MNHENLTPSKPESLNIRRNPGEPYIAPEPANLDWRRLEVASKRFSSRIGEGINHATEHHTLIDHETARCIAHTFGRAFGRQSALAEFGRTGEAAYEASRDEYLQLYRTAEAPAWLTAQVHWLGTYLIRAQHPESQTIGTNEPYPLVLEELLVPTAVTVGDLQMTLHVAGCNDTADIASLTDELQQLQLDEDPGLQAYLALPNVNALSGDIMGDFHNVLVGVFRDDEEALRTVCDLDEREREIEEFASQRNLYYDYLTPDWEAIREEAEEIVDLADREGRTYVFYK